MEPIKTVTYREFGALGDGKTNDMPAIIKTHEYANANGCRVVAEHGASYYIGNTDRCAVIKTDTDFGNAEFIIDDTAEGVYENRGVAIFEIRRDHPAAHYKAEDLAKLTADTAIRAGDRRIPWLAGLLEKKSMVILQNAEHYDYVRFGCNRNAGFPRREVVIVDKDGTVDADVPVTFDYEKVTDLAVIDVEDTPITVRGGIFRNICCRTVADTEFQNRYKAYQRNISVLRSNVTLQDLDHGMLAEPLPTPQKRESYPYSGFLHIHNANNVKVINCQLTGHTTYYEDRSHIANDPCVPMGTYDLNVNSSAHISFENVTQKPETLLDGRYWGIMGSSYCKCFLFKNCRISRFDAHCGFWNTRLIDCEISKALCVIGGGELYIENVKRTIGKDFIILRSDYGATFNGNITLKNCELCATQYFDSTDPERNALDERDKFPAAFVIAAQVRNGADRLDPTQNYYSWDFGYTCYMPQNVHIENFKSGAEKTYIFTDVRDEHFRKADKAREYRLPQKIVAKGCDRELKLCPNAEGLCGILAAIPVETE